MFEFIFREEPPQIAAAPFNMLDYVYDMEAEIEPMPAADNYAVDFDMMDCDGGNDFDELTQGNLY